MKSYINCFLIVIFLVISSCSPPKRLSETIELSKGEYMLSNFDVKKGDILFDGQFKVEYKDFQREVFGKRGIFKLTLKNLTDHRITLGNKMIWVNDHDFDFMKEKNWDEGKVRPGETFILIKISPIYRPKKCFALFKFFIDEEQKENKEESDAKAGS